MDIAVFKSYITPTIYHHNFLFHITNRAKLLLRIYSPMDIAGGAILVLFQSLLFFQKYQILGGIAVLFFIHYHRKDIVFCKIVYANNYKYILLSEYLLIYIPFCVLAFFLKDPLFLYSPLIFILFYLMITANFRVSSFSANYIKPNFYIGSKDFIWKSGIRTSYLKILIIYLVLIPLMLLANTVFIYIALLLFVFLIINGFFYYKKIPPIFLELYGNSLKTSVLNIYKQNLISFIKTTFIPTIILLVLFYDDPLIFYAVGSYIACVGLLFLFVCSTIYTQIYHRTVEVAQSINIFLIVSIVFPPLILFVLGYSFFLFKHIKLADVNRKQFFA